MALIEREPRRSAESQYKEVEKELKELKKALDTNEKILKVQKNEKKKKVTKVASEEKDLYIERKDKGKQDPDETLDTTPGDHVVVRL